MKILIQYPFTDEEHEQFRQLALELGDHEVLIAKDEEEAIALAIEVLSAQTKHSSAQTKHLLTRRRKKNTFSAK